MNPRIMVLTGPLVDLFEADPGAFSEENRQFIRQVFNVETLDALAASLHSTEDIKPSNIFRSNLNPTEQLAYPPNSGVEHILEHEAKRAKVDTTFAPLHEVFSMTSKGQVVLDSSKKKELENSDLIAVSTSFILHPKTLRRILDVLEGFHKPIILGGQFVNKVSQSRLENLKADYILTSEAEGRFSKLLSAIQTKTSNKSALLDNIPGLYWRQDGSLLAATAPNVPVDFEKLHIYPSMEMVRRNAGRQEYQSIRGCYFRCEFCDYPYFMGNKKVRIKDAQMIFDEWQELHRRGVRYIDVNDSFFTFPRKRFDSFLSMMIKSGLAKEITWGCYARTTELSSPDVAVALREAGCIQVFCGLESGSQLLLNNMNKKTTVEENYAAIQNCNSAKLPMLGSLISGFPGETEETFRETISLLKSEAPPYLNIFPWFPDYSEFSKVPIMQPDRIAKYGIKIKKRPVSCKVKWWGKEIEVTMPLQWEHSTMNMSGSIELIAELQKEIFEGNILTIDHRYFPAASLARHPFHVTEALGCDRALAFWNGFRDHYIRFLHGEDTTRLRSNAVKWLSDSGLVFNGGNNSKEFGSNLV